VRIFISIASFEDPLLKYTIASCYENAKYKENLVFGVFDQSNDHLTFDSSINIRYKTCAPAESLGACWARSKIQTELMEDEELYLQVDSHTLFGKDWDVYILDQYIKAKTWVDKPVLTTYPRSFIAVETKESFNCDQDLVFLPKKDWDYPSYKPSTYVLIVDRPFNNGFHCSQTARIIDPKQYKGFLLAAGFIFSSRDWVDCVPYDPEIFFTGEESTLALRTFTHGYDPVFFPQAPVWHQYHDKDNKAQRKRHWETDTKESSNKLMLAGEERVNKVLSEKITGKYAIGDKRTLKEYACFSGINYKQKSYCPEKATFKAYENFGWEE
tara:strand:+ start:3920 stop:4897 length:978 start_codon:yes stop_codon:yes gene_type:complete